MLSIHNRIIVLLTFLLIFNTSAFANDSDVVNCNKSWKIAILGSSTAFGTGATSYDSSWVGKFTSYIKRRNSQNTIYNLAIPGFTSYQNLRPTGYTSPAGRPSPDAAYNITAALALFPDAIIINMPSNDAANLYSLAEQQDNFEAALSLANAANIPVWVTTTQPRNNMSVDQILNLTAQRDWILTRFGNKAVDFWSNVSNPDGSIAAFYDFDNVHVNNEGHNLFFSRMAAENILDTLCYRFTGTLVARAGADKAVILPTNSVTLDGSFSSSSGNITSFSWSKISGPTTFLIQSPNSAITNVDNLIEGRYAFELTVTDDNLITKTDTLNVVVSSRVLFDVGPTTTISPDASGKYWNNFADGLPGIKVQNAITTANLPTTIGFEIVNRIDGTFNTGGPGTNTGNTAGAIGDYGPDATTDFAFAHPSATNGQWKVTGLESNKQYTIKFWGTRSVNDERIIEIKRADQGFWQEYDAMENTDFSRAAAFTFSGKTEMTFDIRVKTGSAFGHICVVDITRTSIPAIGNLPPVARAGNDITITLPNSSAQLNGTASTDDDGNIVTYEWTKVAGPASFNIVSPNSAITDIDNLIEGTYYFELKVTDNESATAVDTVIITVGSRVLFDIGNTATTSPDAGGKYWNNVEDGLPGIKVSNAISTGNTPTGISLEIINRIDGTFNIAGPGVNTGNTIGDVNDYPNSATTDFAFAHPSATNGQWKIGGLDINREYTIKFWGTRSVADQRIIEIRRADETTWKSYDATNNNDYNRAAVFTFTGKTEMLFDIRVEANSAFGHISVVDIRSNEPLCIPVTPSVSISANPGNTICNGTSVTFTATPTNGGTNPTYQWFNGVNPIAGEVSNTYTSSSLINGDAISVQLTSNAECTTVNPVFSNSISMIVNANLPVSVSIDANSESTICEGKPVTFTATPTNGGSNPAYQWYNGNNPISGEISNTYSSNTLANGDIILVQLTSNEACATGNPATSNAITMTVNPNLPVSVSIAANPGNTICDGTSVTFTATPTNGGSNPAYQWFNGANPIEGQTTGTYTTATLSNGDVITVQLTSNEVCATGNPANSNAIIMTVNPNLPVSVSIAANPGNTICDGTSVTFTATPTNGGSNPTYQWFNGANPIEGQTTDTYTTATLSNGDVITVQLTSNEACTTGNPATSNAITMTVNPNLPVSVSIAANPGNTICDGTSVTFTATPTNGGSNPTYQWFNGANPIEGQTTDTYTTATLSNSDVITVQLTSNEVCATGNPATSNAITMTVNPNLPVSVSIAANPGNTICDGTPVTFTATPTNGGSNPAYQWFNGANPIEGQTTGTYTTATLSNGDVITVQLTSNEVCATGNPATSNAITMTVNPNLPVSVSIAANPGNTICDGTSVTFTATPTNGGSNPAYQWFNGANPIEGQTTGTYTTATLSNGDVITVQLTSNEVCATGNPATSNAITMTVNPNLPVSVSIAANPGNTICDGTSVTFTATPTNGGSNPTYQWFNGANPIEGQTTDTYTTATLSNGDVITVQLTSNEACTTGNPATSNAITMTVNPNLPVSVSIAANPGNTICDGTSVTFTATPTNGGSNPTYQWFNGANPIEGQTTDTYTTATLSNSDVITVQLTSNEVCATGNPATSNAITMTVNPNLPVSVSIAANPGNTICDGTPVTFTATPTNGGSNPTYQWFNGANPIEGQTTDTYTTATLSNGDVITVQLTSNEVCTTGNPATSNAITMTVNPNLPVSVSIAANPGNTICDGTSVTFTATPTNGGSNPTYQWFNGANPIEGQTTDTYTTATLSNSDVITVQLTSNEVCATGNPATSNAITMTVNPNLPVSVSIAANPGNTICDGTPVTFTATPTNGGSNPTYQWFNGANPIEGQTTDTYTTATLSNGDVITVQLTSNEVCTTGNPATSNAITMTVNPNLPVSVSIAANPGNTICDGTSVTFTATPTNGGSNPTYQWFNGANPIEGQTTDTYTTATLSNGDVITVQLTSNEVCTTGNPATSNAITMTVNPNLPVSVSIAANPGNVVCDGTTITFTATPTNGGSNPTYQWFNGANPIEGQTTDTYTTATLSNGDVITVQLTSNEVCTTGNPATSNAITMTVNPNLPVSVSIAANPGNVVCDGTTITFTATPTNGGSNPTYQWFNGANPIEGETSNTYIASTLTGGSSSVSDGNQISVQLTSSESCTITNPVVSEIITISVIRNIQVSVTIDVTPENTICEGTLVTFTANSVTGGNNPGYQWFNGANPIIGETGGSYITNALVNNDQISVQLTSSEACAIGNPATSNAITMTVNPNIPVSVSIAANPGNTICDGTSVTFTATPTNGGSNPTYQWFNGANPIEGQTTDTYTTATLSNGDVITVQLTSNEACTTGNPATSNAITMTVNPNLPVSVSIAANPGNTICNGTSVTFTATPTNGGSNPTYQWFNGANPIEGQTTGTYTTATLSNGDVITVQLTSNEACATGNPATSNAITMTVNPNLPVSVSIAANPGNVVCDGTTITFTATPTNGGSNPTYQWFNGTNPIEGQTTDTYTTATLSNGDVITVQLTSNEACATGNPATSNAITMTVNPNLPVSVSIAANPGNTICDGTSVTFTATPTNGGSNPTYQWFNRANPIEGQTTDTYTTATLSNSDVITVQLTSNEVCTTGNPATSNAITMTVNPNLPVSVSIAANPGNTICDGTSVTFTATPTNGGSNPAYQWFNGANPIEGQTTGTYTTATLSNGDVITVQLTSNEVCATGNPATSNAITMTVNPNLPVSVSIAANPGNTICDGTSVTFTATPTNGGSNPTYQWFNGANPIEGQTTDTYTTSTLSNGDVITVQLTSNEVCTTGNPATSNAITMTVNPNLPVSVSIVANPGNSICIGASVTFTATPTNGGSNPTYQWRKNGTDIQGETGVSYTTSDLANNDIISCVLTSDIACTANPVASSNNVTIIARTGGSSLTTINNCGSYTWNGNTYTTSGTYTYTITNPDGCDSIATLNLTILNFTVGALTGPSNVCAHMGPNATIATYTLNVTDASSIEWRVPATATILSGIGTNTITLTLSSSFGSGVIIATANNPCGSPETRSIILTRATPAIPTAILGPVNICSFAGTSQVATYSINAVPEAISYRWTLPPNATIVNASNDSTSIDVRFDQAFLTNTNKTITVSSTSGCGNSGTRALTLVTPIPTTPVPISGPTNACIYIDAATTATYSIRKVNTATSYIWQVPDGVSIVAHPAGLGVNDTIISVSFNNNFISGTNISVSAATECGSSAIRSLSIIRNAAFTPGTITGPSNVCAFTGNDISVTYSIPSGNNATFYNWILPPGVVATHPAGTGINDTIIEVVFPPNYVTGIISVAAGNGCSISVPRVLTVQKISPKTPSLVGPTDPCPFIGASPATYSIRKIAEATGYNWSIPAIGATVVHQNPAGPNDTLIFVTYNTNFTTGSISVSAFNQCATSRISSINLVRRTTFTPGLISSTVISSTCPVRRYSYAISSLPSNATGVIWTVPAGAVIDSGQGSLRIFVTYSSNALSNALVTVSGFNNCGSSSPRVFPVSLPACPAPFAKINTPGNQLNTEDLYELKSMPNPTNNYFVLTFKSTDFQIPAMLRVSDINGHIIDTKKNILPGQPIIVGSNYKNGIYIAEFIQGKKRKSIKLFKL